jgi:hypothetical protein
LQFLIIHGFLLLSMKIVRLESRGAPEMLWAIGASRKSFAPSATAGKVPETALSSLTPEQENHLQ